MTICLDNCDISDKLAMCCETHPTTKESKKLQINGQEVDVCTSFSDGLCLDYENKDERCEKYKCPYLKCRGLLPRDTSYALFYIVSLIKEAVSKKG